MNEKIAQLGSIVQQVLDGIRDKPAYQVLTGLLIIGVLYFVFPTNLWRILVMVFCLYLLLLVMQYGKGFARVLAPFVGLMLVYESTRSWADDMGARVRFTEMIRFDEFFFSGEIPTIALQNMLWNGSVSWYDNFFVALYMLHFITPVVTAYLLWRWRPKYYWKFVLSIVITSFIAFITYAVFPASPPWLASQAGFISEPFSRIIVDVGVNAGFGNFSSMYNGMSPNHVAAVPSLHASYPFIIAGFLIAAFGARLLPIIAYPILMWVGIVYMGEHYVFDIVAAIIACALGVAASLYVLSYHNKPRVIAVFDKLSAKRFSRLFQNS